MKTQLSPETLAALHTQGRANTGPFVNPATIAACQRILWVRGLDWAASVLMRKLDRPSRVDPSFPWCGEEETLVLADQVEWGLLERLAQ